MNWYVGQKVVCIRNHPQQPIIKDSIYTIKGIRISSCGCNECEIDVGFSGRGMCRTLCAKCGGTSYVGNNSTWWFSDKRFAPLDEWQEAEEAVKELLNTVTI